MGHLGIQKYLHLSTLFINEKRKIIICLYLHVYWYVVQKRADSFSFTSSKMLYTTYQPFYFYVMFLTLRHVPYFTSCSLLYVMFLTLRHVPYFTSCSLFYVMFLTLRHVPYFTSCSLLYVMFLILRHVPYFTSCSLLYVMFLTFHALLIFLNFFVKCSSVFYVFFIVLCLERHWQNELVRDHKHDVVPI
jgi:hypothetical protein